MARDFEFSSESLYRVRSEPSLPIIGPDKDVTVMHAEVVEKITESSIRKIVESQHYLVTPRNSRPTTSLCRSESPHRSHRKMRDTGIMSDIRYQAEPTSPHTNLSPKSHKTRKRRGAHPYPHDRGEPTSSGSGSPLIDNVRQLRCTSLRRTESRLNLTRTSPNEVTLPQRNVLKHPEKGRRIHEFSDSPLRKHGRIAHETYVKSPGVDLVIFAVGAPGTGKTYTLSGLTNSYADRGLIPRTLEEILGKRRPKGYDLKTGITYIEFSENKCYDLLSPGKKMVEVNPTKVSPIDVPSSYEALDLLFRGEVKRKFEKVNMNCGSSVFTIHVRSQSLRSSDPHVSFAKIHFVDTPGVENLWGAGKSDPCTISANLDKLSVDVTSRWAFYLSKAIARPSKTKNTAVYGTSGLVSYLERSLTHGYVILLGMIRPEGEELRKTLSTLRFGCKVARLHTGLLERHQQPSAAQKTAILKDEIDELKAQIETSKLLSLGEYDRFNVCQGEAQHIERLIKAYIKSDFPGGVSETCLLSTAKPDLLLEEIRRQFQADVDFIAAHFPKKSLFLQRLSSSQPGDLIRKKSTSKKRRTRGSIHSSDVQSIEVSQLKDVSVEPSGKEEEKERSVASINAKSAQPRKSKSGGSRKSMAPRKSKVSGKKAPKKKVSAGKIEPALAPIDKEFLEHGKRDRFWLMNEFLIRNKDVADEKNKNDSFYDMARDAKISKAKDLDELRASLGRTRIWLHHLQSKRNYIEVASLGEPVAPSEEEKSLLDKEKDTRDKVFKAIDELVTLHGMLSDAVAMQKTFQEKLQARFKAWIAEIYAGEIFEGEEEQITASQFDKEIPKPTVSPSQQLETKSELDFLKLQESFFQKKLPVMPIINE